MTPTHLNRKAELFDLSRQASDCPNEEHRLDWVQQTAGSYSCWASVKRWAENQGEITRVVESNGIDRALAEGRPGRSDGRPGWSDIKGRNLVSWCSRIFVPSGPGSWMRGGICSMYVGRRYSISMDSKRAISGLLVATKTLFLLPQ